MSTWALAERSAFSVFVRLLPLSALASAGVLLLTLMLSKVWPDNAPLGIKTYFFIASFCSIAALTYFTVNRLYARKQSIPRADLYFHAVVNPSIYGILFTGLTINTVLFELTLPSQLAVALALAGSLDGLAIFITYILGRLGIPKPR